MTIESEASAAASDTYRFMATADSATWSGRLKVALSLLAVMLITAGGAWIGYELTPQPVHEDVAPAPQVVQADHSVIAERAPDAHPPAPRHIIPKGYVEERRESIHVAPDADKKDVEIDLSLVRNGAERRVIASSPDGTIVSALDVPIEPGLIPPKPLKWAAGLGYTSDREVGVWLERDIGRLRLGAEVLKGQGKPRAELRVGVAF